MSPVGDMQSLISAVTYGADEVYLGINEFNARNNVDGFTLSTLKDAVDYAHIRGVKVLLAINILFTDEEMQSALDTVVDSYNLGVDAFIIQDLGLASILHEHYPYIELHASTQMGLHNLEGVQEVLKYGFKRVVLARETPLSEIKRINDNCDIEIEYFVQGALCVSFSGNCYLSSYLNNASGNRGRCKQLCRLPYSFLHNGKIVKKGYLLSAKDFNMIKRLDELKAVGVGVLKIEGRARRPFYVGMVTKEYRKAVDGLSAEEENLKLAFNRNYTEGYFNGNGEIISDIQNHIGIWVGQVLRVRKGKTFNEIFISSNRCLTPKSVFKFYDKGGEKATMSAHDISNTADGEYRITTTQKVSIGDSVRLIVDAGLEDEIASQSKKASLELTVVAKLNLPILAKIKVFDKEYEILGDVCEPAKNQPLSKDDILNCFKKSNDFTPVFKDIDVGFIFMSKSKLNEFRRKVYEFAFSLSTGAYKRGVEKIKLKPYKTVLKFNDFCYTDTYSCVFSCKNVIYSPQYYGVEDINKFKNACKNQGVTPWLDLPNFALEKDIELLYKIVSQTQIGVIVNNYYALRFNTQTVIGGGLNVYNGYTATALGREFISTEGALSQDYKMPYMTLRHCPIKTHCNCSCNDCKYDENYSYKMDNGKILKLKRKKISSCTFYLTD